MINSRTDTPQARFKILAAIFLCLTTTVFATEDDGCATAPEFDVRTMNDERISSVDLAGESPIYLKFWLTTCPTCMAEMPHFVHAYEEMGDKVQFVAVNLAIDGDSTELVQHTIAEHGLEMPVVFDASGQMRKKFEIMGTPTHVVINRDGRIVYQSNAADDELDAKLDCLYRKEDTL